MNNEQRDRGMNYIDIIRMKKAFIILFLCLAFIGCKYEYNYITNNMTPRPAFHQVFAFFTVDDSTKDLIKAIYETMTDEELIDLKYNYYSPIPVFWHPNNQFNPQNTIRYQGNAIYIRGTVEHDNFETLFKAAIEAYKNDVLNKL